MRLFFCILLILFKNSFCEIDDKIIDSLSIELAYLMKMNPYTAISLNFKDRDKICNHLMLRNTENLILSLKSFCKDIIIDESNSDIAMWNIIPRENNSKEFDVFIEITHQNRILYKTKNYNISNYIQLNEQDQERIKFKNYAYKKLKNLNKNDLFKNYSIIKSSELIEYQYEILREILIDKYKINFIGNCRNKISFNSIGDLIIQTKNDKFQINSFFSLHNKIKNRKIKYCFILDNGLLIKKNIIDSLDKSDGLLNRENVLYPSKINDSINCYYWRKRESFIGYYSNNGLCSLTYSENPIALVKDITDNKRIWKISLIGFRNISIAGNIVNSFSLYSVRDFYKKDAFFLEGDNNFYFHNYFTKRDDVFSNIVEKTNKDILNNFVNRVGGIHWNIKDLILNLIIEDVLNRKKKYGTI